MQQVHGQPSASGPSIYVRDFYGVEINEVVSVNAPINHND